MDIELGKDDWGLIVRGDKGRVELFVPNKEEHELSEICHVLLGVKKFESALITLIIGIDEGGRKSEEDEGKKKQNDKNP